MGMLNSLFMVFGTVLSQAVSLSLARPLIWRWSLGLTSCLAVSQIIASYFVVQVSHEEEVAEEERAEEEGLPLVVTCGWNMSGRIERLEADGRQKPRRRRRVSRRSSLRRIRRSGPDVSHSLLILVCHS